MRKHALAGAGVGLLSAFVMTLGSATAVGAETATQSPASERAHVVSSDLCGAKPSDKDQSKYPKPFTKGTTNVRSGPDTSCGIVIQVNPHNKADYHCYHPGEAGDKVAWTYMRVKESAYGWVRNDMLSDGGSGIRC